MRRLPLANREEELALFDAMVAGTTGERILLFEARGKLGKTTLVKEFVRRCQTAKVPCVPVDLKGGPGLHEVLTRLCDGLGWEGFPVFAARVESLGRQGGGRMADAAFEHVHREDYNRAAIRDLMMDAFTIDDLREFCYYRPTLEPSLEKFVKDASKQKLVMIVIEFCQQQIKLSYLLAEVRAHNFEQYKRYYSRVYGAEAEVPPEREMVREGRSGAGEGEIRDALRTADEGDRATRRGELTRALFADLGASPGRVVLLFDTFEHGNPEVRDWLAGLCLAHVHRATNLAVVITGREVPEESIEWAACCQHRLLANLDDVEAWDAYARGNGWNMPRAWIEAYCAATHGNPGQMHTLLVSAAQSGGGQ